MFNEKWLRVSSINKVITVRRGGGAAGLQTSFSVSIIPQLSLTNNQINFDRSENSITYAYWHIVRIVRIKFFMKTIFFMKTRYTRYAT